MRRRRWYGDTPENTARMNRLIDEDNARRHREAEAKRALTTDEQRRTMDALRNGTEHVYDIQEATDA